MALWAVFATKMRQTVYGLLGWLCGTSPKNIGQIALAEGAFQSTWMFAFIWIE